VLSHGTLPVKYLPELLKQDFPNEQARAARGEH